jgi:foldase protein PrsA
MGSMGKFLAVAGACLLLMGLAPAGGSAQHVPGDAVAIVDGHPVAKADFDRWSEIFARSDSPTGSAPAIPDPPSHSRCIAALRERAGRRGRKAPPRTELRARCRRLDTRIRRNTMVLLVQAIWFEKEAEALGIEVPDAKVEDALRKAKRQSFRNEREYRRFLRISGMTEDDVRFQLRVQELATAITRRVQRGAGKNATRRLEAFGREFQKRWRQQTQCRKGFVVTELCG